MTTMLEQAFAQAAKLPPLEQDQLAEWILAELDAGDAFDRALASSSPALSELAAEALAEHRAGKTREVDLEQL